MVDEELLLEEREYVLKNFPRVTSPSPTLYEVSLRAEGGRVKQLAEEGVWPFTQYVKWHRVKIEVGYLYPFRPPSVTWLTDIDHPNIIPGRKGKVCLSILGKGWRPSYRLSAVINGLYFLLQDPNPYSAYPNKRCKKAAMVLYMYGFPLHRPPTGRWVKCPSCSNDVLIIGNEGRCLRCGKRIVL